MFIAIEGLDFTGKSTLVKELENLAISKNKESRKYENIYTTRSPGGTGTAEYLRVYMLSDKHLTPDARNLLTSASRLITSDTYRSLDPGLKNTLVISDRWTHSGYAYQVIGEGTDPEVFKITNSQVIKPDLYIILKLDPVTYQERKESLVSTTRDVMEEMLVDKDFQKRVEKAVLETRLEGSKYVTIDVQKQTPQELALHIYDKYIAT